MPRKRTTNIEPPELPRDLQQNFALDLVDHAGFERIMLSGWQAEPALHEYDDVLFDRVHLMRVNLSQQQFKLAQLLDVVFDTCDLTNSAFTKAHLQRIAWHGCRLTGLKFADSNLEHVHFSQCNAEYAQFWACAFKSVHFEQCNLREASFENSNLTGVILRNCDLSNANFRGAKLAGADLRGSIVANMQVGVVELRNAIIDPLQAVQLAGLLGLTVKDLDEN